MDKVVVIGVPSSAGARRTGQERAPDSFRRAGLIEGLRAGGREVIDSGDLDQLTFRPDPTNPQQQNLDLVLDMTKRLARQVSDSDIDDAKAIVLGGDCTITLGVLAG